MMLRRQRQIHIQAQKLVDAGLFALGLWLAHWIRSQWGFELFGGKREIEPFAEYLWLLAVIVPLTPVVLAYQGFYHRPLLASRRWLSWQLFKGCTVMVMGVIFVMFLLKVSGQQARSVVIFFGPVSFGLVFFKEELLRWWLGSQVGREQLCKRLIMVGTAAEVGRMREELQKGPGEDLEVVADLDLNRVSIGQLVELLHEHSANVVLLNGRHILFGQIEKAIQVCELEGVEVWLVADFFQTQISRTVLDEFQGRPMLVFQSTPEFSWQAVAKQVMDLAGAAIGIMLFSPVLLGVALLVKATPGPILFRQQRSGLNGRPFTMLKFRSMVSNAEQRQHELQVLNEMSGPVFKVTNDPRITPVGRWIRRYSLDELPQLFNVLRGEMSLVGPRPLPVDEVRRFDDLSHRRRLSVRPGITCLWQVSGRSDVKDFNNWVRLDLEYIDHWSLWLDVKILLRTLPAVLRGTGAK